MTEVAVPHDLAAPDDFQDLAEFSARIGCDSSLIQAAGGNTSIKEGEVMWIKASGSLLADARTRSIFVPVNLPAIRSAMIDPERDADQTVRFTLEQQGLRPSIETSLHAVFDQRVVVHVHCVNTLAHAIRTDAAEILAKKLEEFNWCLVPYVKPGATLAGQVRDRLRPETNVVILANHGLIVAADTVAGVEALLSRVVESLQIVPPEPLPVEPEMLVALAGPGWHAPPADAAVHQLALSPARLVLSTGGSLYPDHVIFCGIGVTALNPPLPAAEDAPVFVLLPGKGAVMRADATDGVKALIQCLGEVLQRVPENAELNYLTFEQNAELLNWDAEKYRQKLND